MRRGELWISADGGYVSKPRPVLIIQSDRFNIDKSVVTCLVTSLKVKEKDYRVDLPKTKENGLENNSYIMIDKLITIPRKKLNKYIGKVDKKITDEVYAKLIDFLAE